MRRALAAGAAAALALAPRLAEACPYCAGQSGGSVTRGILIGSMIAAPFLAVAVAVPLIIRMGRRSEIVEIEPGQEQSK